MLMILFFLQHSMAQSEESVQQMIKKAKMQIENAKGLDPKQKKEMIRLLENGEEQTSVSDEKNALDKQNIDRLKHVPTKAPTDKELEVFIAVMRKKLQPQLSPAELQYTEKAVQQAKSNGITLSNMAVGTWYTGQDKVALYMALQAAELSDNDVALCNIAAILNLGGYEEKALPILMNIYEKHRSSPVVLNNLGQAWYGLGDKKRAKQYLSACLKSMPNHPEACHTIAEIFLDEGDEKSAIDYLETSIRSGYNKAAADRLQETKPGDNLFRLLDNHFKGSDDLPQMDIKIPPLSYQVNTNAKLNLEHEAFRTKIKKLRDYYEKQMKEETDKIPGQLLEQEKRGVRAPFSEVGTEMYVHTSAEYGRKLLEIKQLYGLDKLIKIWDRWNAKEIELHKQYKDKALPCSVIDNLRNHAMDEYYTKYQEFIDASEVLIKEYAKKLMPILPLMSSCPAQYNTMYYSVIDMILAEYSELSPTGWMWVKCEPEWISGKANYNVDIDGSPVCRFKLCIPFVIGKMKFDCSTFEMESGEGITLGVKRDFRTRQSTLSIGVGGNLSFLGAADISGSQGFFVTFDETQQPTDIGMKSELKASLGNCAIMESGVEYVLGINSGVNANLSHGNRSYRLY